MKEMDNSPPPFSIPQLPGDFQSEYEEFQQYRRQQHLTENTNNEMRLYTEPTHTPSAGSAIPHLQLDDLLVQPGRDKLTRLDPDREGTSTWFKYSGAIPKTILKLIRDLNQAYVSYENFPETLKNGWFRAFTQEYNWDQGITTLVRAGFEEQAKLSMANNVHEWKKRWLAEKGKPRWMSERVWAGYVDYWSRERTKHIAGINSQNRLSDRGGDGIAIHNNGSKTFQQRKQELTESNGGVEPSMLELLQDTHTCKKTGLIKDKKVKRIVDTVQEQVHEITSQRSNTEEGASTQNSNISVSEINRLVIQATPKVRGRRLGFGTLPDPFEGRSSLAEAQAAELAQLKDLTSQQNEIIEHLQAKQEKLEQHIKEKDEKMHLFMKAFYEKFPSTDPDASTSHPDDDDTTED